MTQEQVAEIRRLFAIIDRNGDGSLNADEIYHVLKELGREVSLEEVQKIRFLRLIRFFQGERVYDCD